MKPGIASVVGLTLAWTTPALAQPAIINGVSPERDAGAVAPDCALEAAADASARLRCRALSATGASTDVVFRISAQPATAPARCRGAEVVRLSKGTAANRAPAMVVIEGSPTPACEA